MEQYKQEFIEFMVESEVLKFGEFTLKSGRKSPFFMNAGAYVTGEQLHRLGLYYARAIHDTFGLDFDVVFGPAYKGIPLSVIDLTCRRRRARCSPPWAQNGAHDNVSHGELGVRAPREACELGICRSIAACACCRSKTRVR